MMKTLIAAAGLAALSAAPTLAQNAAPATPAPAASTPPGAPASASLSVQTTPIEALADNPQAKAVLDKHLPGLLTHPSYPQFKAMTLAQVAPMSQGHITDDMLKAIQVDLDQIK